MRCYSHLSAADFETRQDRLSGAQAALHVLLPVLRAPLAPLMPASR